MTENHFTPHRMALISCQVWFPSTKLPTKFTISDDEKYKMAKGYNNVMLPIENWYPAKKEIQFKMGG